MSSGAASSLCATIRLRLVAHLVGRPGDRLAADGQRARAVGVQAERARCAVSPWMTSTLSGVDAEPVGDDLGEAGLVALAVRRGAGVDGHRAGRVHAHDRGLAAAAPAGRQPLGPSDARRRRGRRSPRRWRSRCRGSLPARAARACSRRNASTSTCSSSLSSDAVVVAGVVDEPDAPSRPGILRRDEVLPPQLEPVHAELGGELVHHHLDQVGAPPGRPGAADRVGGELVREHAR